MQLRVVFAAVLTTALVGGAVLASTSLGSPPPDDGDRTTAERQDTGPPADPGTEPPGAAATPQRADGMVDVDIDGFLSWAALDRTTEQWLTSPNATETSSAESMIKAWIVADHLHRLAGSGARPSDRDLRDARLAIRHSHNGAAQRLYNAGGQDRMVERMIDRCRLEDSHIPDRWAGWWSRTEMSAADAVRLGRCIADGTAAGPDWTDWLLEEMRNVEGTTAAADQLPEEGFEGGRWGIIDGLPEQVRDAGVAIKNGWTRIGEDDSWHVNCLAITDHWVMAVMMRYPAGRSLEYGAERCAAVARQLTSDPLSPERSPKVA